MAFTIVNQLFLEETGTDQLNKCMKGDPSLSRKIPPRYKIIALGFVRQYSLDEVNQKLQEKGFAKLYARSLWESSLIFAFQNGYSFERWEKVADQVRKIRASMPSNHDILASSSKISMETLRKYIEKNSDMENSEYMTMHRTQRMESELFEIGGEEKFIEYLKVNLFAFSTARDKTRYYFCKYLYYYLERKIKEYLRLLSVHTKSSIENEIRSEEIQVFKGPFNFSTKSSKESIRNELESAPISSKILYKEFGDFFSGYTTTDWMHVFLDYYDRDLNDLPPQEAQKLCKVAKHYDRKYKKMEDAQILQELSKLRELENEESDSDNESSQKGRMGEHSIRKYIKGQLDLDRVTFICFLLFYGTELRKPVRLHIDEERLNTVLKESGFRKLDGNNDFDNFVINYLNANSPILYLADVVTEYVTSKQDNYYLYKLYRNSRSADTDMQNLTEE